MIEDIMYFNITISSVISIGVIGVILDLIYARYDLGVFNIPIQNSSHFSQDISMMLMNEDGKKV